MPMSGTHVLAQDQQDRVLDESAQHERFAVLTHHGPEGWRLLRGMMRAIFWPCVFGGVLVTITARICLWMRHPVVFSRQRWFRLKVALLAVCIPSLHLMARGRVQAFSDAIDDDNLEVLADLWRGVTQAWIIAFVVLLLVAMVGRVKPRLGQNPAGRGGPAS